MISFEEFVSRLSSLSPATMSNHDVEDLADAAGVRIDPAKGIDARQAQQLLDHVKPPVRVSGDDIVASHWPPPTSGRPAAPSVVFSSPGSVDAPSDPPARPRRSGPARSGRPGPRRSGN